MKKFWLLFFIVSIPLSAFDFLNFSDQSETTSGCYEQFGYCPVTCEYNRSFFWSRPIYHNQGAQKPLWQQFVFTKRESTIATQVVPLYQQSFGTRSIARYLLFDNQINLLIKGDNTNNLLRRDVRAEWLGLPDNFTGTFSVHPKQKQFGIWIEGMMPLSILYDCELLDYVWFGIAAPYQTIENRINPSETPPINPSPTFPRNTIEALSNPEYLFGKFYVGKQKRKSFAEIDLKIGSNLLNRDNFQIGLYSMFVIPLHGAARPEFVFNPYIGNNGHFGYGTGVTFKLPLICDASCQLFSFFAYFENIYFFRSRQKRTFDLIAKPWSRYILLNSREGAFNVPAINILTRHVRARPYNMLDLYTGFDWEIGKTQIEIGYGLWARGRESAKLDDCFPLNFGIAGVGTLSPTDPTPATASMSTIAQQGPNDVDLLTGKQFFVPITVQDIDFDSGAARGALSHRAHFSVGYIYSDNVLEALLGIGGFIEISQYNTALSNWGLWAKAGLLF